MRRAAAVVLVAALALTGCDTIEGVEAVLVFDVFRFEPGATLSIQDVVVK
jgi:hypothetical protein